MGKSKKKKASKIIKINNIAFIRPIISETITNNLFKKISIKLKTKAQNAIFQGTQSFQQRKMMVILMVTQKLKELDIV